MKKALLSLCSAACLLPLAAAEPTVSDLGGVCRNGQVFLQWKESSLPADARLSVWSSAKPLSRNSLKETDRIAALLNPKSAGDWWQNIDSFLVPRSKKVKSEEIFAGNTASEKDKRRKITGFVIEEGGKPLDPAGGLHVHTPNANQTGKRYFAVTVHRGTAPEIIAFTTLKDPIDVKSGKVQAIRLRGAKLTQGCAKGLPLLISLHGRGGGAGVDAKGNLRGTHLLFAPASLAWREGIPFKFDIYVRKDHVVLSLFDRVWIGRTMKRGEYTDSRDAVPAIATFWMGYNPDIAVSAKGPKFRFDNFTERYILFVMQWVQEYLGTDVNRTYIQGGSMGGTGAVHMATHFPDRFAAVNALVPIYSYTWKKPQKGQTSAWRLTCSTGAFSPRNPALMPDGKSVLEYGNGAKNIAVPGVDMPPIFATNGRNDTSMPWVNNPPFFAAADKAKQFISVYWNDGGHAMSGSAPADMKIKLARLFKFRLNESFPVFSKFSDNRNYGNGDPKDGDPAGWINRGIDWQDIKDTPQKYEITLKVYYPQIKYPVTADVTIRRRQQFRFAPGTELTFSYGNVKKKVKIDKNGLLTLHGIRFDSKAPVKLTIWK
ncbi:MAG: hypothetical protein E7048_09460 [Lentisphaerae bacterium]|nr:hypothetical protein [Lentisphaerota bacterium]